MPRLSSICLTLLFVAFLPGCKDATPPDSGSPEANTGYLGGPSDDTPPAETQPRALLDEYRETGKRQAKQGNLQPWQNRYDVPLDQRQTSKLNSVIDRLKNALSSRAQGGIPEIAHIAIQTGEPNVRLLVNLWFTTQLNEDESRWRYELTVQWQDDTWVAVGGTSQQGIRIGRELDKAFVEELIGGDS